MANVRIGGGDAKRFTAESSSDSTLPMKVLWSIIIGFAAWVMVSFAGIEGIRMLSNLGGLPAMFLILASTLSLVRWLRNTAEIVGPRPAQTEPKLSG